jgi:carboxypeptidase Taq
MEKLKRLHALDSERMYLSRAAAVLQWDQETYLPPGGVEDRAEQLALIEGLAHEKLIDPEIGRLLEEFAPGFEADAPAGAEFPGVERDFLRVLRRDYHRAVKLPADFVRDCARAEGLSQAAWVEARKNDDFGAFAPHLQKMLDLARKKAGYWGFGGTEKTLYDGLLDFHEPGMSAEYLSALFKPLGERLSALLRSIAALPPPDDAFLHAAYDPAAQEAFNRELMAALGFDSRRGRLDTSAHPFTTTLGFNDVRITTRYFPDNPLSGIFSVIHESGHAFYELGIDPALRSSCLAEGVSMGIHESQSRLWENVIGRSRAFWEGWFPRLKERFPVQLGAVSGSGFYRALNRVKPSLIRVDADELSYSLHIILRFELEKRLFSGDLSIDRLPSAWNEAMKDHLGIEPENAAEGVLQDVHWSMGAFGYFPSYALGNLYGLHFWKKLKEDIPGLENMLERREYDDIHEWLKEKIHCWGRRLNPGELFARVTGETQLSPEPFLDYIEEKYQSLYGI